jgi:outer membrane protein
LGEALQRTYWTNPQLLSERARTRSTDFLLPQARGEFGPQLQYSGTYGYQRNVFEQATGSPVERSGWTSSATAVLTQPLFTFGRLRANEDSARAQIAFRRSSLAAAEQQILLSAINAYAAVLRDRAGVAIAQSNADLLAREFSDTRTRLEARDSTIADVQQIQTRLELARAQLLAAQGATASSDALFLRFVGAPAGELAVPSQLAIPARTLEDAYAYADANNPVITSAYARERVSRAQLELSKADLLPRVDLRGQASISTLDPYSDSLRQTELRGGVTISGTLDTGIRTARIGEAAAANDADWRLIDDTIRENRAELAEAWNNWLSQTAASERLRLAVQAAESALQGALIQQRAGLRTTTEILELARDLLQVRSSLNSALATSFVQQARVLSAMGALKPELFMATDAAYDPTVHGANVADDADLPLLTGAIRELDSLTTPPRNDRPVRDPAVPLGTDSVAIDPAQP